ncbi:hypothetical protein GCM10012275_52630 [Longimycelium tulufanense]|uniref:Pentapeptide repeat-containing protein n=1 Tax=Longimycelium tulufanense TaxID=907463 RepID=A0A8J3FYW4_9PSEU|nr:hypothetical protein GCM10012275_52630 [Longimycelium tulufanense]
MAVLLVAVERWWQFVDWPALARWVWGRPLSAHLLVLSVVGVVAVVVRTRLHRKRQDEPELVDERPPIRVMRWWMVLFGVALVMGTTWWAAHWLLTEAAGAADPSRARIEAMRTALTVGAGTGGGVALLLAARKQWLSERTQAHNEDDATERRITELYTKAVEQLGSDKAPVRLGGLYALERLAQNNPSHRQTIVDVICAYLRMPYTPPHEGTTRRFGLPFPVRPGKTRVPCLRPTSGRDDLSGSDQRGARVEELQVRLAAQDILTRHLRPGPHQRPVATFWDGISLNLTKATLVNMNLNHCRTQRLDLGGVQFSGEASFGGAQFSGEASFGGAQFSGNAWFGGAQFSGNAWFGGAQFSGIVDFSNVQAPVDLEGAMAWIDVDEAVARVWPEGWSVQEPGSPDAGRHDSVKGVWGYLVKVSEREEVSGESAPATDG